MGGKVVPVLVLSIMVALNCVSSRPQEFPSPIQNRVDYSQPIFYPSPLNYEHLNAAEDKPKNCFHFFVSRNMSSLLADATKMLRTIRDLQEREWILTFIYRIKSLAEHLRSHPESQNYNCLPSDEESKKNIFNNNFRGQQQPELYFVDEVIKRSGEGEVQQEEKDNPESSKSSLSQPATENLSKQLSDEFNEDYSTYFAGSESDTAVSQASIKPTEASQLKPSEKHEEPVQIITKKESSDQHQEITMANEKKSEHPLNEDADNAIVLSAVPDCERTTECELNNVGPQEESPEKYFSDSGDIYPIYPAENLKPEDIEHYEHERLKRRIRKALLEELAPELKKLKTVGGTPEDLMNIWNAIVIPEDRPEADFDYEESGTATGGLNLNERTQSDRTIAPSLDEVENSKGNSNRVKDKSYEPYDDSDVLVQQLFDIRFEDQQSKTTKSLSDQNNNNDEYLITSTHTPF